MCKFTRNVRVKNSVSRCENWGVAPNALHICVEGRLTLLTMWKRCVNFLERERYVVVTSCVCAWWTELKTNECEVLGEVIKRLGTLVTLANLLCLVLTT